MVRTGSFSHPGITLAAVVGAASWNISSLLTINDRLTRLEASLPAQVADRYTGADAKRDRVTIDTKFQEVNRRLDKLENR